LVASATSQPPFWTNVKEGKNPCQAPGSIRSIAPAHQPRESAGSPIVSGLIGERGAECGWVAPRHSWWARFSSRQLSPPRNPSQPRPGPPPSEAALIQQANDALAASDFSTAFKILTTLNSRTPSNPQVLYDLGLTLEALAATAPAPTELAASTPHPASPTQEALTAESCYRKSIAANPLFPAAHVALGLLLARTGRPAEARTELLSAANLPDTEPALKARALRALARLDLDGSAPSGTAAQAISPNPTTASEELLAALKLTPEQPEDILLSAEIAEAVHAGDSLAAAEQAYRRFLAIQPGDPGATAALAHVLLAEHRPADAETLLTPALAHDPGNPSFTAQLAEAYLASNDSAKVAQAQPLIESLHAAHPDDQDITRLLARVLVETGHLEQADPLYAALIAKAQPTSAAHRGPALPDPTLLADRAEVLLRLHRPGEAETLLKQAVADRDAFPTPAAFADAATRLAFAASEIDDPRTTLQALALRATVLQPSPSSLFLEATAEDALHQTSKAIDLYNQFLVAAGGNFPDQESQARQRLAALKTRK